ncbi:DUF6182 family protein [Streptomyces sp. V4-01]|uniref:DUF6182 family protein n=1 Tax=Actinacidiphila polyblastidii TaxID=3110430 RepID=A0ABU7P9J6_9ACTN|nr:DUF6182 family protein [Streptomyces sp. V4-01]
MSAPPRPEAGRTAADRAAAGGTGSARTGALPSAGSPSAAIAAGSEPGQARLRELFAARARRVGREPVTGPAPDGASESPVLVLLRSLDLAELVGGVRQFAAGLGEEEAADWERSWTLTRFLFGNPANLAARLPVRTVAPGGSAAWLGPFAEGRLPGPCRLLKPLNGRLPRLPATVACPAVPADGPSPGASSAPGPPPAATPRGRRLHVAVRGLGLVEYLVHLHHTLAEAVLLGLLRPDEPLVLTHCQDIDGTTASREPGYARVHFRDGDPDRLRLYTWLDPKEGNL